MQGRSCVTARGLAALVICLAAGMLMSGCSSSSSSSAGGLYPSVLTSPMARDTTPLSPDEVKQAMDNLITERNHLCAEAIATSGTRSSSGSSPGNCAAENTTTGGAGTKP
jgi:hypothetical protein